MNLHGNFTALVTPFKQNKEIDYSKLEELCIRQTNMLSNGIVALGSTAEATALNIYEKHKSMETIVNAINNQIPVIAGVNAFSLNDAIYQSEARFLDGANALLISPPPYLKPTQKGLLNFFTKLADHSLIPIILYNIPSRTGVSISISTVKQLSTHPNIVGIKDASGDISYTQNIINQTKNNSFSVLAGNDNQLLPVLSLGGTGIISVFGNIDPKLITNIISLYKSGFINEAKTLYFKHLDLINCLSLESNPIAVKYALYKLGLIKNVLRQPLTKLSQKNAKILSSELKNFITSI